MDARLARMAELKRKKEALKLKMEKLRNRKNPDEENQISKAAKFRQRLTEKKRKASVMER